MLISFYSYFNSVIIGSLFVLVLHFIKGKKNFKTRIGISSFLAVSLFCSFRMLFCFNFPVKQIIVDNSDTLAKLLKPALSVAFENENTCITYLDLFFNIFLAVTATVGIIMIIKTALSYVNLTWQVRCLENAAFDREYNILETIKNETGIFKNVKIVVNGSITTPMVTGFFRPVILLPDCTFSYKELYMILRHEYTHILCKDLFIKLYLQVFCCIFWWNPLVYLMKNDIYQTLELRCDSNMLKKVTAREKLSYLEIQLKCIKKAFSPKNKKPVNTSIFAYEFASVSTEKNIKERFIAVLSEFSEKKLKKFNILNIALGFILAVLITFSFFLLFQPSYMPAYSQSWSYHTVSVSDSSNSYLKLAKNGYYYFFVDNKMLAVVSSEKIEDGLYRGYPVVE